MEKFDSTSLKVHQYKKLEVLKAIEEFSVRNTDVFLTGYPKSGTTWAQEMIWLIVNDLDYEGAKKTFVDERFPIFEMSQFFFENLPHSVNLECHTNSIEYIKKLKDPRCIKTHIKGELFPKEILEETKKPKIGISNFAKNLDANHSDKIDIDCLKHESCQKLFYHLSLIDFIIHTMDKNKSHFFQTSDSKKLEVFKAIREFPVRNTDVFLAGYPKSGTTWLQEMIWLIVNDLDYEGAKKFVDERVPIIEMGQYLVEYLPHLVNFECHSNSIEFIKKMKDPRCVKTHIPGEFFPKEIVDGTRKPKVDLTDPVENNLVLHPIRISFHWPLVITNNNNNIWHLRSEFAVFFSKLESIALYLTALLHFAETADLNELIPHFKLYEHANAPRNPKDVCISTYHYLKDVMNVTDCTFEEFSNNFVNGQSKLFLLVTTDFIIQTKVALDGQHEDYWKHVLYFWERRNHPNVLFIKYEDMKKDLAQIIQKVASFLERTLTDEELQKLVKWLDFETMKNNDAVNHNSLYPNKGFIRSGKVGDHKKIMSEEINKKFDSWIEENLKDTDYKL
ncbi:hypothetical protein FQR65_LT18386 [Abscondita terminalis]|nr:hypothetical protein FQR65_LT18386 [Abscondita terminalis]